jgi:hypothetical protein
MECEEGKRTIAQYILGAYVSRERLEEALASVRSDREYLDYLHRQMGSCGWVSPCDILQSRLDEFAEMTLEERESKVPELTEHFRACPSCQEAYWQMMPLWIDDLPSKPVAAGQGSSRRLAEPIVLTLGLSGRMTHRAGPLRVRPQVVAAAAGGPLAGAPDEDEGKWQEWILPDDETGVSVELRMRALESGEVRLAWTVKREDGSIVDPHRVRIRAQDRQGGQIAVSECLSRLRSTIHLPAGSWNIRLSCEIDESIKNWEIPLDFEQQSHE